MQLVIPKRKDLRLYAALSDTAFTATTFADLKAFLRNARSHVDKAVDGTSVKLNPVMGISSNQLLLTRVTNLGVVPDMSSDVALVRTLLPLANGLDATGRCTSDNELQTVNDTANPWGWVDATLYGQDSIFSYIPTLAGSVAVSATATWAPMPMRVLVNNPSGSSYSAAMYQTMALYKTSGTVSSVPILANHNATFGGYLSLAQSQVADAATQGIGYAGGFVRNANARYNIPEKIDSTRKTVPYAALTGNTETPSLSTCIIPVRWGYAVKVFKLEADTEFGTASNQAVGATPTITMAPVTLSFNEVFNV